MALLKFQTQICEKKEGLFHALCRLQRNFCALCLQCPVQEILFWSIQHNKQTSCVLALDFSTAVAVHGNGKTLGKSSLLCEVSGLPSLSRTPIC